MNKVQPILTVTEKHEQKYQLEEDTVRVIEDIRQSNVFDGKTFTTMVTNQGFLVKGLKWQLEEEYQNSLLRAKELYEDLRLFIEKKINVDELLHFRDNEKANEINNNIYLIHKMLRDYVFDYEQQLKSKDKLKDNLKLAEKKLEEMDDISKTLKAKWAKDYKDKMAKERKSKK